MLVDSLGAGQTGCLEAGAYHQDVRIETPGITLTSYPGQTATLVGRLWVSRSANGATVSGLHLDGTNSDNLPSPTINANSVTFSDDDVTDRHTAICFDIGSDTYGTAIGTVLTRDRIHDCGVLPAQNHNHGIYLQAAYNTRISWNLIYANADRGIQLYPDAQNTTIDHNVIDGNGENIDFSGDGGIASSGANVYDNVLSGSTIRHDVESWYPDGNPLGQNNLVHNNCMWGGAEGTVDTSGGGFTISNNTMANPQYVNPAAGDYDLKAGSACLGVAGNVAAVVDGTTTIAAATAAQPTQVTQARTRGGRAMARIAITRRLQNGRARREYIERLERRHLAQRQARTVRRRSRRWHHSHRSVQRHRRTHRWR